MPEATEAAAPTVTVTPTAVSGSPAPAPAAPAAQKAPVVVQTVQRKTYATRLPPAVAQAPAPMSTTPAAPAAVTPPGTEAIAESGAPTGVDPAKVPGAVDEAKAEAPLAETEAVKRLARLHRTEARLSAEKQAFAAERQAFAQERAQHAQSLERVKMLEEAAGAAQKDPLTVLRSLDIHPQHVLDAILGDTAKAPAQRALDTTQALEARLAGYEKELKASQEAAKAREQDSQVQAHIAAKIAPVLADGYPYLKYAASIQGLDLGRELYKAQYDHYQKTGIVLDAKALADEAEAKHAQKAESLLGVNAKPKQPASPSGSAPPKAKAGAQAIQPQPTGRQRFKPAYVTKVVAR